MVSFDILSPIEPIFWGVIVIKLNLFGKGMAILGGRRRKRTFFLKNIFVIRMPQGILSENGLV
jgi:hypothetical protein